MYLEEAEARVETRPEERTQARPPLPSDRWQEFPHSAFSHHGEACCEIARQWVLAMDYAQLNGGELTSGPRWIRAKYKWGPSPWPMHWCEVVKRKVIDCGAHAALANEAFRARGLTSFPAQLVQRYSEAATEQWQGKWQEEDVSCHWLDGEHIYHEATALLVGDDEVKIWDGSAGSWVNARQQGSGYGSLIAVRIFAEGQYGGGDGLRWGERRLKPGVWNQIAG
ncbi:MAG TPA: hypothetical protein VGB59_00385 [Allosphingosinicella sp.]|jgi:hypothetical protein